MTAYFILFLFSIIVIFVAFLQVALAQLNDPDPLRMT
jgi:hypothetical protein